MGDKRVAVAGVGAGDDVGEGMQCSDHPYRRNPGGICAFCLQEKLGKLVSSSKSSPFFAPPPSTSSSSSPTDGLSFGFGGGAGGLAGSASSGPARTGAGGGSRTRIPFLAAAHKKKKSSSYVSSGSSRKVMASTTITSSSSSSSAVNNLLTLKRSKSVAPRPVAGLSTEGGSGIADAVDSPRKKSFWSFLYLSSSSTSTSSSSANNNGSSSSSNSNRRRSTSSSSGGGRGDRGDGKHQQQQRRGASDKMLAKEEAKTPKREHGGGAAGGEGGEDVESPSGSQASSSFGRKVARSRSVGCGSRSFSGDFFERISTGFGDCTLRRVESQREAKPRLSLHVDDVDGEVDEQQRRLKERFMCGGLFGGFGMISSSSSSYWLSADDFDGSRRISSAAAAAQGAAARGGGGGTPHGRTWTWAWAFASPMRAFRPAPSSSKLGYPMKNGATAATTTNIVTAMNASNNIINGAALPAAATRS